MYDDYDFCTSCEEQCDAIYLHDDDEEPVSDCCHAPIKHEGKIDCQTCRGTGIGQHGDPDTSRCGDCHGRGYFKVG